MLIRQGDTGVNVINLQYGLYTLNFNPKEIDGIYGNRTIEAVKAFQTKYNLLVDGIVGENTWRTMVEELTDIQNQLNKCGFSVGDVDGISGQKTQKAIKAFQISKGISADGIVGPITRSILFNTSDGNLDCSTENLKKIFIDPGHGGNDSGAVGNGLREKDISLSIAKKLGDILVRKGYQIKYSRDTDTFIALGERANIANKWGADLFLSIHCNAHSDISANGTECYTYSKSNSSTKDLSRCISSSISNKLEIRNRGHKEANFAVLRLSNMSAVLIEVAFISNKDDANKLNSKQDEFAQCIATQIDLF